MTLVDLNMDKIFYCFQKEPEIFENNTLFFELNRLMDDTLSKINEFGVIRTSQLIFEDFFHFRLSIIKDEFLLKSIIKRFNNLLDNEIEDTLNVQPTYLSLKTHYLKALEVIKKISIFEENFSDIKKEESFEQIPSYNDFLKILNSIPSKSTRLIQETLTISLILDYLLFVSHQILKGNLQVNYNEIFEIENHLKTNIEKYAVNLNFLDIWKPEENDESQWIRNIKILIARNEFNVFSHKYPQFSSFQLKNILEN